MRRYILYMIMVAALLFPRCTGVLDVEPENSVTYTNYFKTVQDAEAILSGWEYWVKQLKLGSATMYPKAHCSAAILADRYDYQLKSYRDMSPWYYPSSMYRCYQILEAAHMMIDNAHRFSLGEEVIRPYVQQAHFARAIAYFELAREWGEAPIIKDYTNYIPVAKSSVSEVLDEVEKSALIALALPVYENLTDGYGNARSTKQYGCKGAAAALLAQLYAWRAAVENKPDYWEKAEKYCTMIINGEVGNYQLAVDPQTLCNVDLRGECGEGIWEILQLSSAGEFLTAYTGQAAYLEQKYFVTYPVRTDSRANPDPDNYSTQFYKERVNQMYDKEDRRRDAYFYAVDADSLFSIYDAESGQIVQKYTVKEGNKTQCFRLDKGTWSVKVDDVLLHKGDTIASKFNNKQIKMAFILKYRYPYYKSNNSSLQPSYYGMDMNRLVWRLADIYLLRAECRAYMGASNAKDDLNEIRCRAYGDHSHDWPCASDVKRGIDQDIKLAIFREREKEFLFEDNRWWDIVRNGLNTMNGHGTYDFIRKELSPAYAALSNQDILNGALYLPLDNGMFENNELLRQNIYWNEKIQ